MRNFLKVSLAFAALFLAILACDVDQNFPPLVVGAAPRVFDPWIGETHDWPASVTPGVKYEVELKLQSRRTDEAANYPPDGKNSLMVRLGNSCSDCFASTNGFVTVDGLKVSFVGPPDGKVLIFFFPSDWLGKCSIRLYEYGKSSVVAPENLADKLANRGNAVSVLSTIFLSITLFISVRKSRLHLAVVSLLNSRGRVNSGSSIFAVWLALAVLAVGLLLWIWFL